MAGIRLPSMQLSNVVGTRHKLHPCIKHEKYRGSSHVTMMDQDPDSKKPLKTTSQVLPELPQAGHMLLRPSTNSLMLAAARVRCQLKKLS